MKSKWFVILMAILCMGFIACGGDSEDVDNNNNSNSQNHKIVGTKWTSTNWDYSLGDDYAGIHDEIYQYFFHSISEGTFYYKRKDNYSDQGVSYNEVACHFKYEVEGNKVILDYITDSFISMSVLNLNEDILTVNDIVFKGEDMSYSDRQWISTVQGTTGDCAWYSDMCGKLWITGEGAIGDYSSFNNTPWAKNGEIPNKVIVNEGVTKVGSYAFANSSISEVELPDKTLEQVGNAAFAGSSIKTIWLSQSTTSIGKEAFAECAYLKDINIPESIESIGEYAFSGCALNEYKLEFGTDLREIGNVAFEGGEASYLTFAEGIQTISTGAFIGDYCGISKELILPNSLTSIGATVFEGPYKKIVIGTGVAEIGEKAFISGATSGEMYINLSTPPSVGNNIIVERENWSSAESRWTLYVPKGCKSAYSGKSPWNKFKTIVEDETLEGGMPNNGEMNDGNRDPETGISLSQEVDLGLSVKWAGWNIGASSPEEYGGYYAWGEIEEKTFYTCESYKYVQDTDGDGAFGDEVWEYIGNNISGTQYDVVRHTWKGSWRMPTESEFRELKENCTWTLITYKGVKGFKVKASNGNAIFLPLGGCRIKYELNNEGYRGDYWSGSLGESSSHHRFAYRLYIAWLPSSSYPYAYRVDDTDRDSGMMIRPVLVEGENLTDGDVDPESPTPRLRI